MDSTKPSKIEHAAMWLCLVFSFAIANYLIQFDRHYWFNLVTVWEPHLIIIAAVTPISTRPAALSGVAVVLAIYLALFSYWVSTLQRLGGYIGAGYFFTLPGAAFGAWGAFL